MNTEEIKIKKILLGTARLAGKELLRRYQVFKREDVKLKLSHEILTAADLASERIILKNIKSNFPDHQILSEEAGKNSKHSDYLWVVDPLDGTTNFSMHNPLWSVSIAVFYKKRLLMAVVFAPFLQELFFAQKNQGAFMNGRRLKVSKIKSGKVLNTFCHGSKTEDIQRAMKYYNHQKLNNLDCRQMGSAAIELAYVAAGRVESIAVPGANAWDVAAGALLVQEAGGKVSDFNNRSWGIGSQDILASNGRVHQEIIKIFKDIN